jgi:hypothetical protein
MTTTYKLSAKGKKVLSELELKGTTKHRMLVLMDGKERTNKELAEKIETTSKSPETISQWYLGDFQRHGLIVVKKSEVK